MTFTIPNVWYVNKNDTTPLFKQLANNIRWSIAVGSVRDGYKLPPVRVLAKELSVGVDTVRAAYKLLGEMGLLISRPHYGSQVVPGAQKLVSAKAEPVPAEAPEETAAGQLLFQNAITNYLEKGEDERYIRRLFENALEMAKQTNKDKLLYVDDDVAYAVLAQQMTRHLGAEVEFMMRPAFFDLAAHDPAALAGYHGVVTTYFHLSKMLQVCQPLGLTVRTIVTEFSPETMNRIARLPAGAKVAVVCLPTHSREYLVEMVAAVRNDLDIRSVFINETERLNGIVAWAALLLVTPPADKTIAEMRPDADIRFFCDTVNAQSLGILRIETQF